MLGSINPVGIVLLVLGAIMNAITVIIFKAKMNDIGEVPLTSIKELFKYCVQMVSSPLLLLGVVLFGVAPFVLAAALSRLDASYAYSVFVGLNLLFVVLIAAVFIHEPIGLKQGVGIALVIASIFFLSAN